MRTITLAVSGMHCASCGLLIDDALLDLDGVRDSCTDTRSGVCTIVVEDHATDAAVLAAVAEVGYSCTITASAPDVPAGT